MSKKKSPVIDYNGQRLLLETITGYVGIYLKQDHAAKTYGVRFNLRTGETIEQLGTDSACRDKVLDFLDNYFKPVSFSANKCQVCAKYTPSAAGNCQVKQCYYWENYPKFERKEENGAGNMAALDKL